MLVDVRMKGAELLLIVAFLPVITCILYSFCVRAFVLLYRFFGLAQLQYE